MHPSISSQKNSLARVTFMLLYLNGLLPKPTAAFSFRSMHARRALPNQTPKTTMICNAKLNKIASSFDLDEILSNEQKFADDPEELTSAPTRGRRRTPAKEKKKQKLKEQLKKQQIEKQQSKSNNNADVLTIHWQNETGEVNEDEDHIDCENLLDDIDFEAFEVPSSLNGKRIDAVLVDLLNKGREDSQDSNNISFSRSQCGTLLSNECVFIIAPDDVSEFQQLWKDGDKSSVVKNFVSDDLLQQYSTLIQRKSHPLEESSILIYPSRESLTSQTLDNGKPSLALKLLSNSIPPTEIIPQNIPLDILYEDEYMIVINKQAGMVVHPAAGNWDGTVVNALSYYLANESPYGAGEFFSSGDNVVNNQSTGKEAEDFDVGNELMKDDDEDDGFNKNDINQNDAVTNSIPTLRPGIVHRLDKGTTGVLVVAKTQAALATLSEAFADRRVKKQYLAVAIGNPGEDTINKPIERHPLHRQKMRVVPDPSSSMPRQIRLTGPRPVKQGRPALSYVKTLHFDGKLSIVQIRIATGRTHQIRVHLQDRGTPIYGDDVYGLSDWNKGLSAKRGVSRPLLHAQRLEIGHPVTGEKMVFEAKVADDMMGVMEGIWPGDEMKALFG
mmetsp:Transcript_28626/g.57394  ORF Transcript_28626/g.57394 Transcript_28626/m.57394 type:complete len:613 (-) Transcript_28626:100-1938(-)